MAIKQLPRKLDPEGVLIQANAVHTQKHFWRRQEQRAGFLLRARAKQKALPRQNRSKLQEKRKIPFEAWDHEAAIVVTSP